ncbi:MAG: GDSL-type esterase/lipase family protein [Acholeplasmataceae bacterium]
MSKQFTILKTIIKADYEQKIIQFSKTERLVSYLLIGDSLIGYFPQELIPSVYNQGIPGDTTLGVLNRLDLVIRLRPTTIIIHVGSNDLVLTDLSTDEIVSNIKRIVETLQTDLPNTRIYVLSLFPINEAVSNKAYLKYRDNKRLTLLNRQLEAHLVSYYYPIDHLFKDEENNLKLTYTKDGLHLTPSGYQIFYEKIKDLLEERDNAG